MSYGKINFKRELDSTDRDLTRTESERRYDFSKLGRPSAEEPKRAGRVCPSCDLFRTDREFFYDPQRYYEFCSICRGRGKVGRIEER